MSNIAFSGLFSGLSTDELITALVSLRRTPITQLENLAEQRLYEKTAYTLVNTRVLGVKASLLNLRLESTFRSKTATSSQPGLLSAIAGLNAQAANHSISIQSIAAGAKAITGLNDKGLERAALKMAYGNTAGIASIAMSANSFGGTRALGDTRIIDTLQAGTGSAEITVGDRIKVDVTLKDTSTNTIYFDFADDGTDTLERLRQTIQAAFQGEAQVSLEANGGFLITETNSTGANTISLDALTFEDQDYSGSTLTFTTGNTTAGNVATYRTLTGSRTFTTGSSATIATGAELLTALDQYTGGALSGDETIQISGTQYDGDDVSGSLAVTGATTLNDLITELQTQFNDGANPPWETTVTLENGKIVLRDQASGTSTTSISMYFDDPDGSLNLNTGTFVTTDAGSSDISQTIRTSGLTVEATGKHLVRATEGRGGVVTGTVSLEADTILSSLGVTETALFTIDRDNGGGAVDPVSVFGVNDRSTVQELIDAINAQVPGVTAQLADDGAGSYNLQILASKGGVDIRLTDDAAGNGILENVIDPDGTSTDTDISTLADAALSSVDASTAVTTDYTLTTTYTPSNGGPVQRRTVVGTEGSDITTLIEGAIIQGYAGAFTEGDALLYAAKNSELKVSPATSTYILGQAGIGDPTSTDTPPVNIYTYIDQSNLNITATAGTFTINGVQMTLDSVSTQTTDEMIGLINSSGTGVLVEYDSVHDRFMIHRPDAGNTNPITLGGVGDTSNILTALGLTTGAGAVQFAGTAESDTNTESALAYSGLTIPVVSGTFTINGVKITVSTSTDSLDDIIDRINDAPAGVTASYDSKQDRLVLSQDLDEPPLFNRIQIGSATDTSNFWSAMRLTDTYQTSQEIGSSRTQAILTVDGTNYQRDHNEIDDIINDVTLNLKGITTNPVALDIEADTSRATEALRDFVVAYNELQELVDIDPLTDDEQSQLAPLTDSERAKLTFTEIDAYELNREDYAIQDFLFGSSTLNRLDSSLRRTMIAPVESVVEGETSALFELGISTGDVGFGVELASTSFLVKDSVDPDVILSELENNYTLQSALENRADEVFAMFGNEMSSETVITGDVDITVGITLGSEMTFTVGNGTTQATVNFTSGFHSSSQIFSTIQNAIGIAGLANDIRVFQGVGGGLQFESSVETGRARISIQDPGGAERISNVFGIGSQTVVGSEAINNAGLSRRLDAFLDGYTGTYGILRQKIRTGGLIDQELLRIGKRMDDYEYRLSLYELRLRRQFASMEVALASFEQTSQFLEARLNASSGTQGTSQGIGTGI